MTHAATTPIGSNFIEVEGLTLHYLSSGEGHSGEGPADTPPALLLHGWPTNAQLWRHALPAIGASRRAIALDLPGFGGSDKPTDASYSFRFYDRVFTGLLDALKVERVALVVHDLGGPVGLHWAANNPARVSQLVLLNTLVFPEMSWAAKLFFFGIWAPGLRHALVSQWGLKTAIRVGVNDDARVTPEVAELYQAPYRSAEARLALLKSIRGLHPKGFHTISEGIKAYEGPLAMLYGEDDRILPDVAETMARVKALHPRATLDSLPSCGHFLQEDQPERVAAWLAETLGR